MEKSATITLRHPAKLPDGLLTQVIMKRPTIGDLIDYPIKDASDMAGELRLYAHLCGLNEEDLRHVDAEDYRDIQRQFLAFQGQ